MLQALPYCAGLLLPAAIAAGVRLGGPWTFLPVFLLLGVAPFVDWLAGLNLDNHGGDRTLSENPWFRLVTWIWAVEQPVTIAWALAAIAAGGLRTWEAIGVIVSLGMMNGTIGITFAHELVHRAGRFERALGEVLLATASYTHFAIEHVYGHHRHVATPRDPATARFGEGIYHFVPRSVFGGMRSAWSFETGRLAKRGRRPRYYGNRLFRYAATQLALYAAVAFWFGVSGLIAFAAQAFIAIWLVETINYIEHYGLVRREAAPGRYERVMPWHSWDSSHKLSNYLLINLARHSDHHMLASKRYQVLDHLATAPQLPAGYGSMFMLALVPPLWRRVMDPRVRAWRRTYAPAEAS